MAIEKIKEIYVDDVQYVLTLSDTSIFRVNDSIFRGSQFGNEIDKKVNEYNFQFAPDFIELRMDITVTYGKNMDKKFKESYLELLDVAIETNTPISPNNLEEIQEEFVPLEEDGNSITY